MTELAMHLARLCERYAIDFRSGAPPEPSRVLTPKGQEISLLDWGGEGKPVIFLHGGSLSAHSWDLVCLALWQKCRCVAIDLRGHGLSAWSDDYSIEANVGDLEAVIDHFGWPAVHVVGMSLGGCITAHYAARPGARADGIVIVDVCHQVSFASTTGMRAFFEHPISEQSLDTLVDAAVSASRGDLHDKIHYRFLNLTKLDSDGRLQWRADRRQPRDFDGILGKMHQMQALAPTIAARALVVRGASSRVTTDEDVDLFAGLFRDGHCVTIPGAAHNVQEDTPKALAFEIANFVLPASSAMP
jgi:pimeloyl-ACP methyl ester carboxylesterase